MKNPPLYDLAGIGIGPFNLGLAALLSDHQDFKGIFFETKSCFDWHPGMLIQGTTLQVPFYADLVTLANPCSRFSFLCFLKASGRLFPFAINENYYVSRKEFNQYCRWVTRQLISLRFNHQAEQIRFDKKRNCYRISITDTTNNSEKVFYSKKVVLGIGTSPRIPENIFTPGFGTVFHSAEYLGRKKELLSKNNLTIIGSGQSAAEIFYDLLSYWHTPEKKLNWFTRSEGFYPMEVSKFSCELSTPDYINYFYQLNPVTKRSILEHQNYLYKGISNGLLNNIYQLLYDKLILDANQNIGIYPNCELQKIDGILPERSRMSFFHREEAKTFLHESEAVILATGYQYAIPSFIRPIRDLIKWTPEGSYDVSRNYSIDKGEQTLFVQNAELHSHGFTAPDIGLGAYRNGIILNTILGKEYYEMKPNHTFLQFGIRDSGSGEYGIKFQKD